MSSIPLQHKPVQGLPNVRPSLEPAPSLSTTLMHTLAHVTDSHGATKAGVLRMLRIQGDGEAQARSSVRHPWLGKDATAEQAIGQHVSHILSQAFKFSVHDQAWAMLANSLQTYVQAQSTQMGPHSLKRLVNASEKIASRQADWMATARGMAPSSSEWPGAAPRANLP